MTVKQNGKTRKEAGDSIMKKRILQRTAALALMVLLLCVSVFGAAQETVSSEDAGTEATDTIDGIVTEEAAAEVDLDKLVDENAAVTIASEEIKPSDQKDKKEDQDGKKDQDSKEDKDKKENQENTEDQDKKEGQDDKEDQKKKEIMILFTSDIHCGVYRGFGLAGLYQIRETLEKQGYETLLVDDGDAIQGEVTGLISKGESITKLMNEMHYDVAIPGNHEFDYGMDQFLKLVDEASFPYISCNITKEDKLLFDPYIIKEAGDVKIAFVGVTTPMTPIGSHPAFFQNEKGEWIYGFMQDDTGEKLYAAVQKAVDDAKAEGADLVYLVAHLGNEEECKPWTYADVVANTSGIDVVLDGHSHDTDQVVMKNKDGKEVVRSAVGTKMNCIGYSHISSDGKILDTNIWTWENKESAPSLFGFENKIAEKTDQLVEETDKALGNEIGETIAELTINDPEEKDSEGLPVRMVRRAETNLGDLIADAFRIQSRADIGLANAGGIRDSISKGKITTKDLLTVMPFNSDTCVVKLTGQQILDALEWGAREVPSENGGFLQTSGLSYEIHSYIDSTCEQDEHSFFTGISGERRVHNVKVGNEDLDPEKTYTVCSLEYTILDHGDGFTMFDGCEVVARNYGIDVQLITDYIAELGGVVGEEYADPYGQGRIVIVEEKPEN